MLLFAQSDPTNVGNLVVGTGALVAACVSAAATIVYVVLTYKILRSQTDPCVIAYTQLVPDGFVNIIIENVGRGLAHDVRFDRHPEATDEKAWETFLDGPAPRLALRATAFGTGIPALPPGGKRVIFWGKWIAIKGTFGSGRRGIVVVCKCKRATPTREVAPMPCILEVASLDRSVPEESRHQIRGWKGGRTIFRPSRTCGAVSLSPRAGRTAVGDAQLPVTGGW